MKLEQAVDRAEALIEALPFIQRFRGQTFVIKYGGSAMEDDHLIERLLRDVVFLEAVGINPVLVHGGGKAITSRMREAGLKAQFVNGLRVTDEASIAIVSEVLDQLINPRIVETIDAFGGKAYGFSGADVFVAHRLPPQPDKGGEHVDVGFVGEVVGLHLDEVKKMVDSEIVPVISPIACDESGTILNVNADIAAGAVAAAMKASKLIYLSDVPGIMRDPRDADSLISSLTPVMITKLIADEIIAGGMIPKVESAIQALEQGVSKAHLIDGRVPHALLIEIFTNAGIGTELVTKQGSTAG